MDIKDRISKVREEAGLTQAQFAEAVNIQKNTIGRFERGEQKPDSEELGKILETFRWVSPSWLLLDEGSMRRSAAGVTGETNAPYHRRVDDQYSYVPLYDVRASAGHGAVVDQELVVDSLAFKSDWIRMTLGATPSDLYLIKVEGESMEPTLRPGDVILVDHRAAASVPRDGIYVLRMDSSLLVKRLQRLPGGVVKVTSDNPAYEPFVIQRETSADDLVIIGRVVWCGRRM
jgi:phage repressor protein C with HTH and peptisase S24 domain